MRLDRVCLPLVFMTAASLAAPARSQEEQQPVDAPGGVASARVVVVDTVTSEVPLPGVVADSPAVVSFSFAGGPEAMSFATPLLGDMAGPGLPFFNQSDPTSLLNDPQIQRELELVDTQVSDVRRINRQFREKQSTLMKSMMKPGPDGKRSSADPGRMGEIQAAMADLRKQRQQQLEEVILPDQRDRLKQLGHHMTMSRRGVASALTAGPLAEELNLTDEQKKRLAETSKRLQDEIREELKRLRAKAKKEIFAELTPDQRDKLDSLVGDDFQYQQESRQERMRRVHEALGKINKPKDDK